MDDNFQHSSDRALMPHMRAECHTVNAEVVLLHAAVVCACYCSSILPIPFAISKTGVLVGCLTMVVVAWANDATSCMLIRAAGATGKPTYEALAEWAGGRAWKVGPAATVHQA